MKRHSFSVAEREAIWLAHDERCWLCRRSVGFGEMEVEHVIPVDLGNDEAKLASLIIELKLPKDFQIESFENWRPAHRRCNGLKSDIPYDAPLVGVEILSKLPRADRARKTSQRIVSDHKLEKNVAAVFFALESKAGRQELFEGLQEALQEYVAFHEDQRSEELKEEPLDLGFGYLVSDGALRVVHQPYGIGVGPSGPDIPYHMRCPSCGNPYFSGARCTLCGDLDDF